LFQKEAQIMSGLVKGLIAVVICIILLVIAVVGTGAWWWSKNKDKYLQGAKQSATEGRDFGKTTDEKGCVGEALSRYKSNTGFAGMISAKLFVKSCLEESKQTPGYCDEVPKITEFQKLGQWQVKQCKDAGVDDGLCPQLFAEVVTQCYKRRAARY
jgi:hypothetical protein